MPLYRLTDASVPAEILLEIFEHIPFEHTTIRDLSLVHPRFRDILKTHENSIMKKILCRQLPHALVDFPLELHEGPTYAALSNCIRKYDVIDHVMCIIDNGEDSGRYSNLKKHNVSLVYAGLLLLSRVSSFQHHKQARSWLETLPLDPLVAMLLAIHHCTRTAGYWTDGIMNQLIRYRGPNLDTERYELKNQLEFSFAEGMLCNGPSFAVDIFLNTKRGQTNLLNLYHNHMVWDWWKEDNEDGDDDRIDVGVPLRHSPLRSDIWIKTLGPERNPGIDQRTLWTTLRERIGELSQFPLHHVQCAIMVDTDGDDHSLAYLDLWGKERLMAGLDLVYTEDKLKMKIEHMEKSRSQLW